jgi:hypothetical protein
VWSYDAATKRYALTLKGETTTYTLLSRGDPVTCILYKGDLDSLISAPVGSHFQPAKKSYGRKLVTA